MYKFAVALLVLLSVSGSYSQLVSYDEFLNAATWLGYPAPSWDQWNAFQVHLEEKADIHTKQEAAMALTHYIWESDGLRAMREYKCAGNGCPGEYEDPSCDIPGLDYYGRGYIQLTWCYNYRQASIELYGNDWMIYEPDAVAADQYVAWDTAFWFWKAHVHNQWGVAEGMFGVTTRAINGPQECDGPHQDVARHRFEMYKTVRAAFGLDPNVADERGCYN